MKMTDLIKSASEDKGQRAPTRLQTGDIIDLSFNPNDPKLHLVFRANECRACLLPMTSAGRVEDAGKLVDYDIHPKMVGISPNTECTIVKRLGKTGMIEFLENKQATNNKRKDSDSMSKNKNSEKTEEAPKLGKLGGFLGHSLTSVIRAMGKLGWEYWEAVNVFASEKIPVAENTVRIQLAAGKRGQGGEPAPISAELKKLRPDASEKPVRKTAEKAEKKGKKAGKAAKAEKSEKPAKKAKKAPKQEDPDDTTDDAADESPE